MHDNEDLLFLATLLRRNGGNPEKELRRALKRSAKWWPRIVPLLEMEKERRREREEPGLSAKEKELRAARHKNNEEHRRRLRRMLALAPPGYHFDPTKKASIWATLEKAEQELENVRRHVGQKKVSHGKRPK
jgi:hypothetical protein